MCWGNTSPVSQTAISSSRLGGPTGKRAVGEETQRHPAHGTVRVGEEEANEHWWGRATSTPGRPPVYGRVG